MNPHKKLYFFTATFPYGHAETFVEDEIKYLSAQFDQIVIVPLSARNNASRSVPDNCKVLTPVVTSRLGQYVKGLLLPLSLKSFLKDFIQHKVFVDKSRAKAWVIAYVLSNNLLSSKTIKRLFKNIRQDDVCYFYWGKGANVLSCYYKGKAHFVSRFHGEWDLWEESSGGYAPLRQLVAHSLDASVFISEKGKKYFEERYIGCKTYCFPLGSNDMGFVPHDKGAELRVVSCSTVYPLKRVPLIFEAIKSIKDVPVSWTHIGGGVDFEALKQQVASSTPSNVIISLLGEMPHDDVMKYYKEHQFDVFVNVSINEGVPVSIMEAMSFDIPVVATNVGGNSEVVTVESGILISANPGIVEVADAIVRLYNRDCHPRSFWEEHYSAEVNYTQFANFLKTM